jgi:hypothetical protein
MTKDRFYVSVEIVERELGDVRSKIERIKVEVSLRKRLGLRPPVAVVIGWSVS